MVSKTLIVLLVAACCVHSLDAWPWNKKTTTRKPRTTTTTTNTPAAPAVMPRKEFLSRISTASKTVAQKVAKTHQLVLQAEQGNKQGQAVKTMEVDIAAYTKQFTDGLLAYANKTFHTTVDLQPCVDRYLDDKAYVEGYLRVTALASINSNMQDVRDTPAKVDSLLDTMASLTEEGEAEAARPDGEYGEHVDAILEKVEQAVRTAQWNNEHVDAVVYALRFATSVALTLTDGSLDMPAARGYAMFCMRRTVSTLAQH